MTPLSAEPSRSIKHAFIARAFVFPRRPATCLIFSWLWGQQPVQAPQALVPGSRTWPNT
jgi:hypothetical protein